MATEDAAKRDSVSSASTTSWRLSGLWSGLSPSGIRRSDTNENEEQSREEEPASQSMHSFTTFHTAAAFSVTTLPSLPLPDEAHKKADADGLSQHDSLFDNHDEDASVYIDDRQEPWSQPSRQILLPSKSMDLGRITGNPHTRPSSLAIAGVKPGWLDRPSIERSDRPLSETFFRHQMKLVSQTIDSLPTLDSIRKSEDRRSVRSASEQAQQFPARSRSVKFGPDMSPTVVSEDDEHLVGWDGSEDVENPMNWPRRRKWLITAMLGLTTFCVTFASSILSPAIVQASAEFGVQPETFVLATSLFVLGFAFGPICWGPLSELYGRRRPLFLGLVGFGICQIPVGAAPNLATVLVCRFLQGLFGCAPLAIIGGMLSDFWAPVDRGVAVSLFSAATFMGPTMGPIFGGYLTEFSDWRNTAWLNLSIALVIGSISFFVCPETYAPVLLQRKARKIRCASRNWAIHAPAEEQFVDFRAILGRYLTRPFAMLYCEPILLLMTIYIAFIYGILYGFFETYPISFNRDRGWGLGASGLPFLAVMIGVLGAGLVSWAFTKTRYVRIQREKGHVPPEERLLPMMVGSVLLPLGLIWFAWTSNPNISPASQIIAGIPTGMGIVLIFLQGINYIVDTYKMLSASALAGNIFIRSLVGFIFPLFAPPMFESLGIAWANTVLAFIAVALIPVPIFFYFHGAKIRRTSRFAPPQPAQRGAMAATESATVPDQPHRHDRAPSPAPIFCTEKAQDISVKETDEPPNDVTPTSPEAAALPAIPSVASPIKC